MQFFRENDRVDEVCSDPPVFFIEPVADESLLPHPAPNLPGDLTILPPLVLMGLDLFFQETAERLSEYLVFFTEKLDGHIHPPFQRISEIQPQRLSFGLDATPKTINL
jgi:hypothetical protein